ncbi:Na+/H+ antiporter NhaA, partial [Staphylococcus sp. SIMBA_130]
MTALLMFMMNRCGVKSLVPYLLAGFVMWFFMLQSGVHATVAGILMALFIPLRTGSTHESPLERLEHGLEPWVVFLILPVFGFANAGVS